MGCSKPDRSEEATQLKHELQDLMYKSPEQALVRVDSAEQAGIFSAAMANLLRTNIYGVMGQTRLAVFYGERILNNPELKREGDSYYSALLMLNGLVERHPDEAERYYLESINMMMDGVTHTDDYWVIDGLFTGIIEATEFYLEQGKAEKALALVAKGDTALARLDRCPNVPDHVHHMRHNNITIGQAMIYAANGQRDRAEALYLKHRQAENPSVYDIGADARYLVMTNRYDEAIRLFRQADSLYLAKGNAINTAYIKNYMMNQYKALQKAGRKDEVLALADRMRQLTDSIHLQERKIDVERQQEIRQKEAEVASRRQTVIIYRILAVVALLVCMFVAYMFWRAAQYNKIITEKNRRLLEEIEQREREQQQSIQQLESAPEESLTAEQQLYRRLCALMAEQQPYTDENLNRETLAQLLGTNAKYVVQTVRECSHGETVGDFITRYRLEHVAHLLKVTDDPIGVIGELSGIPSRVTLSRLFRNAYGMTCREYRQVSQQKE